jgi:hypothetical protein
VNKGRRSPLLAFSLFATTVIVFIAAAGLSLYARAQPKRADTVIRETSFRLTLPGPWIAGDTSDPNLRTYRTANGKEGLTVSIFGSFFGGPGEMNHDEKAARFRLWVNKRKQDETKIPDSAGIKIGEPFYGEAKGTLAARYEGFDSMRHRRFHCMLLANSSAFEVF